MKRQVTCLALAALCAGGALYLRLHGVEGLPMLAAIGGIGASLLFQGGAPA